MSSERAQTIAAGGEEGRISEEFPLHGARRVNGHGQGGLRAAGLLQGMGRAPCSMCSPSWA